MSLDLDGILHVAALEKRTGLLKTISVRNAMAKLSDAQLAAARARVADLFGAGDEAADDVGDDVDMDDVIEAEASPALSGAKVDEYARRVNAMSEKMDSVDKADFSENAGWLEEGFR